MKMSRSKKKVSIAGITTAASDKEYKRRYNRRFRRVFKQVLGKNPETVLLPDFRQYSNVWNFGKEGKKWFDPKKYPKLMRK